METFIPHNQSNNFFQKKGNVKIMIIFYIISITDMGNADGQLGFSSPFLWYIQIRSNKNIFQNFATFFFIDACSCYQGGSNTINIIDPSELLRPEPKFATKPIGAFRDFNVDESDPVKERVRKTYEEMHTYQTVDFVKGKCSKFQSEESAVMKAEEYL